MAWRWVDAHLDLAYLAEAGRQISWPVEALPPAQGGPGAAKGRAAVTLASLREGGVTRVFGTIFTQPRIKGQGPQEDVDGPWCYSSVEEAHLAALRQVSMYLEWHKRGWVRLVPGKEAGSQKPEVSSMGGLPVDVVLLMEGAAGVRTPNDLRAFHLCGVRVVGLTWARGTQYAGGNISGGDLTEAGRELVGVMDELGIVHDVSHLSEKAFWSLMATAKGPKIATHSNCRALLPGRETNERHLTDEQIRALGEAGGMIGINLFTRFLRTNGRATIDDVVRHAEHIAAVMGRRDGVGLGSDMDGGFGAEELPVGLEHPRELTKLADALLAAGWSARDVEGFVGENWGRFIARHVRA